MFLVIIKRNDAQIVCIFFKNIILNDVRFLCGRMFSVGSKTLHIIMCNFNVFFLIVMLLAGPQINVFI